MPERADGHMDSFNNLKPQKFVNKQIKYKKIEIKNHTLCVYHLKFINGIAVDLSNI